MPVIDLHSRFGLNLDRWILTQSGKQPYNQAARCHAFEKEWIECSNGIGQTEHGRSAGLSLKTFMNACTVRRRISDSMKSENRKKNWQRRRLKMLWTTTEHRGAMAIISLQECMLMLDPTSASYTCGVSWGFM